MAYKERLKVGDIPPRRVENIFVYHNTEIFDPSCSKNPIESDYTNTDTVQEYYPEPDSYARFSEYIAYISYRLKFVDPKYRWLWYRRMNPCNHLRQQWQLDDASKPLRLTKTTSWDWEEDFESCRYPIREYGSSYEVLDISPCHRIFQDVPLSLESANTVDPYLSPKSLNFKEIMTDLDRLALDAMIPKLDDGFSLPRSLVELLELKQLFSEADKLFRRLPETLKKLFKRPLSELSSHYLAGIFGALPFISDVKTFAERYQTIADDVSRYIEHAGKWQTYHFEKYLSPATFKPESWFESDESVTLDASYHQEDWWFAKDFFEEIGITVNTSRRIRNLKFHGTLEFAYVIPEVHPALLQILAEGQRWGFKFRAVSDGWDLIPFSFVVDWFYDVGNWLSRFDKDLLPSAVLINQYCRSITYDMAEVRRIVDLDYFINENGYDVTSAWQLSPHSGRAQMRSAGYYREVGIPRPTSDQLPEWRTPGGLQWVTLGALALANLK